MANRYWVGAAGNWNDTAHWSTASGGSSGASVPGTADTAIFDANSNTGTTNWTVTVNVSATPGVLTLTPDAIVTFATAGNLAVTTSTSLTASSGTTGVIFDGNASLGATTLATGTMNINGNNVTMSTLTSTSTGNRTFAFGTGGQVTLTGTNATIWNCSTAGTSTFTGTGTVVCSAAGTAGQTRTIVNAHDTGNNLVSFKFTAGVDTASFSGTTNINSLDFTGFSGTWSNPALTINGSLTLSTGMTVTAGNNILTFAATTSQTIKSNGKTIDRPITFNGVGGTWTLQDNFTAGTTRTVTLTNGTIDLTGNSGNWTLSTGIFDFNNANTRSIAFGTGKIIVTGSSAVVVAGSTLTNFSFTGTSRIESNYSGSAGTRQLNLGTTAGGTESNALSIYVTAGSDAFKTNAGVFRTLDFTGYSGALNQDTRTMYGDLVLSPTMTVGTGAGQITTFAATSGIQNITSNGTTFGAPITINGVGGTVRLLDNLTISSTYALTLTNGTFNANGANVTVPLFSSSNSNTRTLTMGSGTWTLSGTGTVWDLATTTNLTFNKDSANIILSNTTATARTFAGGGLTYNNLTIGGTTGTSTLTVSGSNTFNTIASTKTVAHTITLTSGTTTTVSNWTVSGTAGNIVTLNATTTSPATLTKTGGGTINVSYMTISYSTATPGNTWYAVTTSGNVDGGNNTGWIFIPSAGNFLLFF